MDACIIGKTSTFTGSNQTGEDIAKLSALLSMPNQSSFEISRFEFRYMSGGPDASGFCVAKIRRTNQSPPWSEMLKGWDITKGALYSGLIGNCTSSFKWFSDILNTVQPPDAIYRNDSTIYNLTLPAHRSFMYGDKAKVLKWDLHCQAFMLAQDREHLYFCADGALFLEDSATGFPLNNDMKKAPD